MGIKFTKSRKLPRHRFYILLRQARWMLLVDVWGAYVQDPCPAENITKFIQRIQCAA